MNDIFYYKVLKHLVQFAHDTMNYPMKRELRCISKRARHLIDTSYNYKTKVPEGSCGIWPFLSENLTNRPILVILRCGCEWMYVLMKLMDYFSELDTVVTHDSRFQLDWIGKYYVNCRVKDCRFPLLIAENVEYAQCLIICGNARKLNRRRIIDVLQRGGIVINMIQDRPNDFCEFFCKDIIK